MNNLKIIGNTFIFLAIFFIILGVSTLFWKQAPALLLEYHTQFIIQAGYPVESPGSNPGQRGWGLGWNWQNIKYSYVYGDNSYTSSFIGFYFPVNLEFDWNDNNKNQEITAYILPFFPYISVIKKGFDFRVVIFLIIIALVSYYINFGIILTLKNNRITIK